MDSKENSIAYEACAAGALPPGPMAFVRSIQERFLAAFADDLATRLDTPVAAQLGGTQTLSRDTFMSTVESGGCLLGLDAEPARGQALIAFSAGLVRRLLGILLGAPSDSSDENRPVSEIELHILGEIIDSLARGLSSAWKPAGIAFRNTPKGAEGSVWQGAMLVFECRLDINGAQESFQVATPGFLARLAALQAAPVAVEDSNAGVRDTIFHALCRGSVSVEAVLSGSTLRMGDLLEMERGHVLMLNWTAGLPVECRIAGKPKFRAECIVQGNRQAIVLL